MTEREVAAALCTQGKIERPGRPDEYLAVRPFPGLADSLLIFLLDQTGHEVQRFMVEVREIDPPGTPEEQ